MHTNTPRNLVICTMYQSGVPTTKLAVIHGITRSRVCQVLHKFGLSRKDRFKLVTVKPPRVVTPVAEQFWSKVSAPDKHGCRLWLGGKERRGYGRCGDGGRYPAYYAHRSAWILENGPVPAAAGCRGVTLNVGHRHATCSRACCTPSHLVLRTAEESAAVREATMTRDAKARRAHLSKMGLDNQRKV